MSVKELLSTEETGNKVSKEIWRVSRIVSFYVDLRR